MAQSFINGNDGTADVEIDGDSYVTILRSFSVQASQEMIDVTTFSDEGSVKNDQGRLILGFAIAGLLTKGAAMSGPLIPPPQNVDVVLTFSTGCSLTFTADFSSASAVRVVNENALMTAEGVADGPIVKAWVVA